MMQSFLFQVAEALYKKYGDDISSLNIILPSRRARLFFAEALARIIERPIWQPHYTTVDELMEKVAGVHTGDHIRLISELYKVYSRHHEETFDSFYFWGETLLADFDQIDKYLIDAHMLFRNIADLKNIDDGFEYLTPQQREVVARFWGSFRQDGVNSPEQQRFLDIWNTLEEIYAGFRDALTSGGIAYTGMVYRAAAEKIRGQGPDREAAEGVILEGRYAVVGFNALSQCEKILFDRLARGNDADFFWDYDHYYLDDREQEAGLFMRENIRRYPQKTPLPYDYKGFSQPKAVTVVEAPSNSMQCKYIAEYLNQVARASGCPPGKETAIVLTDESLLVPALHSIPDEVEKINVTMGYPLRLTLAYSFAERLIGLQSRRRDRAGQAAYYHDDVTGLLTHPYVLEASGGGSGELAGQIVARQQIYTDLSSFEVPQSIEILFVPVGDTWRNLAGYIRSVISHFADTMTVEPNAAEEGGGDVDTENHTEKETERRQRTGFFFVIAENLDKVVNSIDRCGIEISTRIFATLFRRVLQSLNVAYEGEPLEGVQVMGILETRNLDFENVLLLSVNDDNFPGNLASSPSFIPHNLRLAYGLPTPQHHEGVYAYYFYRLMQRASNVHIAYSAHSDEKSNGEQSRYIYQLEYESPHRLTRRRMALNVSVGAYEPIVVAKNDAVREKLAAFVSGERKLSPTSLYNYARCPLKFYFHSVAQFKTESRISEEIDAPVFGTILHRAMELLYRPLVAKKVEAEDVEALNGRVADAVAWAVRDEYFKGAEVEQADYSGNLQLVSDIVQKYIYKCILPYDASHPGFTVDELEKRVDREFRFGTADQAEKVVLTGIADRVDEVHGCLRITDYKTGAVNREFKGVEALFSQRPADQNAAAFQTMLYSMMLSGETGRDAVPSLYAVRDMNREDYSPLLVDKLSGREVLSFRPYKEEFESHLREMLSKLFDQAVPFTQCEDPKTCLYCDFNILCKR